MTSIYYNKYIKYKSKYNNLKNLIGGINDKKHIVRIKHNNDYLTYEKNKFREKESIILNDKKSDDNIWELIKINNNNYYLIETYDKSVNSFNNTPGYINKYDKNSVRLWNKNHTSDNNWKIINVSKFNENNYYTIEQDNKYLSINIYL